jgi:hypothetical protein
MQLLVFIIVYRFAKPSTKGHALQFAHNWLRLLSLYRSFSSDVTAAILVYQNNEMAAILVYGMGISSFLFKYFVLFHHPTGATDHVSENDLYKIRILNSMFYHVAFLIKSPLPQLNVELVSRLITKSCFAVVYNIELRGGGGGGGSSAVPEFSTKFETY